MKKHQASSLGLCLGLAVMLGFNMVPVRALAADAPPIVGAWGGTLDPGAQPKKRILVHISAAQDGTLSGTIDYPDQDTSGILITILSFLFLCCVSSAQVNEPDRLMQAFTDRAMADQVARMATDERIKMYETLANYKPGDFHYQSLLAGAFIQKMRETMDPGYLDRASKI